MNKRQASKIIKVIEQDATGRSTFYNPEDDTMCVIGGLLHAAGEKKYSLIGRAWPNSVQRQILADTYGLDGYNLSDLIAANDRCMTVRGRRKSLIRLVSKWDGLAVSTA